VLATHYDIVSVETLPSTQDAALERLATTGHATLVLADHQTLGRARQGRQWDEPTRGLFSSLAFDCDWPMAQRPVISLCTAVALADSIEGASGLRCDVKWPNDLLIDGRKIAGILVETESNTVTVGCGVNIWWPDAPADAGALFTEDTPSNIALEIATGWVDRLLEIVGGDPQHWPRDVYLERSWTIGRQVSWDGGAGRAVDIAPNGGLMVDTGAGVKMITAGEVHTRQGR
jgi:BirA family biotin operon repressor/biotin-[acetyl-CoA-carboxylase] ligase